jgi:hypothetical protein
VAFVLFFLLQLWSIRQTAENTDMSQAFWKKQIFLGHIEVIKLGRSIRLDADKVRAWLQARTRPAKSQGAE